MMKLIYLFFDYFQEVEVTISLCVPTHHVNDLIAAAVAAKPTTTNVSQNVTFHIRLNFNVLINYS